MYIETFLSLIFGFAFIFVGIYKKDYMIYLIGGIISIIIGLFINIKVFPLYFCLLSVICCFGLLTIRGYIVNFLKKNM